MDDAVSDSDTNSPNNKTAANGRAESVIDLASLDDSGSNHSGADSRRISNADSGDSSLRSPDKFSKIDQESNFSTARLTNIADTSFDDDDFDTTSNREPPPFDLPSQMEYHKQADYAIPIYSKGKKRFASGNSFTAVETLLFVYNEEQQYLCKQKPVQVFRNVTFIVDLTSLKSSEDWKADNCGVWKQHNTYTTWWKVDSMGQISPVGTQRSRGDLDEATHVLIMRPYTHSQASDYHRVVYTLRPKDGEDFVAAIQYSFDGTEHQIIPTFSRTEPSVFKELRAIVSNTGPKKAASIVSSQRGGLVGAGSSVELPRGVRQAKYVASTLKASSDPWSAVTLLAKSEPDWVRSFDIREGVPIVSLFNDRQLKNLIDFASYGYFTADVLFELGNYYLLVTEFQHPLLYVAESSSSDHRSPWLLGPCAIVMRKTYATYIGLFQTMKALVKQHFGERLELHVSQVGCDDEAALIDALESEFPSAKLLLCSIHAKRNCKRFLQSKARCKPATVSAILRDLFGDDKHEGLVHSASLGDYAERLESLLPKWDSLQKEDSSSSNLFSAWYKTHKDQIYQARLLYKILDSTLTAPFTTNGAESVNCYVKDWLDGQRKGNVDVCDLITQLSHLVEQQEECILEAFLGGGKWRLKQEYEDAQLSKQSWFSAPQQIRAQVLQKVLRANASSVTNAAKAFAKACQTASIEMTVSAQAGDADISCLETHLTPGHVAILKEAATNIAGKITQQENNLFWVPSGRASAKLPFVVEQHPTKATFHCDKACTTFKGLGVCEHLIAVGMQFNRLSEILSQFEKKKRFGVLNASSALTCDLPRAGTKQSSVNIQGQKRKRVAIVPAKAPLPPVLQRFVDPPNAADRPSTSSTKLPEPQSYPFSIVLLPANVTKCFGCERAFADKYRNAPHNCILRHLDNRPVYKHGMKTGTTNLAPAYYHLNAECVRRKEFLFQPKAYYSEQKMVIYEEVRDVLSEQQWQILNKFCGAKNE